MEKFRTVTNITAEAALEIIKFAITEAGKLGLKMSITIVDTSMAMVAFTRMDGATPHSTETSRRKANSAASTGRSTGWMSADLAVTLPLGAGNLLTNIPGGVPIRFKGLLVGGLGIAGGTVDQDASVAKAVIAAIGADPIS